MSITDLIGGEPVDHVPPIDRWGAGFLLIKDAPRDGRNVIGFEDDGFPVVMSYRVPRWSTTQMWVNVHTNAMVLPLRWMPLPEYAAQAKRPDVPEMVVLAPECDDDLRRRLFYEIEDLDPRAYSATGAELDEVAEKHGLRRCPTRRP